MNTTCFHCGESVAPDDLNPARYPVSWRKAEYATCCTGCQAVAKTIIDAGLDSYYESREAPAGRAEALPDELQASLKLFDTPELQASFVHVDADHVREAALILEGITCAACIWLNERHISRLPGVLEISINYTTHRARLRWDNGRIQLSTVLEQIAAIGYRAHPYDPGKSQQLHEAARKKSLTRLWIAGLSMMQVMMYAVPIYMADPETITPAMEQLMQWASCVLTLPVVFYSCLPFYQGAWRDLKAGRAGMDVPVVVGVLAAFIASVYANWTGHGAIYYDSVSMFVFLLLGGRYLEGVARRRAGEAAESLVKLMPAFAHRFVRWPGSSETEATPVARLLAGDTILVKPGESFPADGVVLEGASHADESLMTGEARPIDKSAGAEVTGGTLNQDAPLVVRIERTGESTRLAGIVRLLDKALAEKPRAAILADKVAAWFVGLLLLAAIATFALWYQIDPDRALPITVAVLVISCPCALSLATPAAMTAATGHMARLGLLITRGHTLDTLPRVTDIVFDKTGTLTEGKLAIQSISVRAGITQAYAHELAAILESASEHPIAHAIRQHAPPATLHAQDFSNIPGSGVSATIDGAVYRLGTFQFVAPTCTAAFPFSDWMSDATVVYLGTSSEWIAAFALGDTARQETPALIMQLKQQGLRVHLLSGDSEGAVAKLAATMGIDHVRARATPDDKLAYVQGLQHDGRVVLMVGDGINDAPVLAAADTSIAIGTGTETAQAAGDAVLSGSIGMITDALQLARKSRQVIRQNLIWAVLYNAIALPVAMAGWITPWLASLGMALSSLLVVMNAIRLAPPVKHTTSRQLT
ncbi:cadmium-translocating P-type ATPase [Burkholderiaceae bacterium DAT-1]|nr:cadmium-translocating P-type ATPase [Burkholderiaceae bacterium DAT-1]